MKIVEISMVNVYSAHVRLAQGESRLETLKGRGGRCPPQGCEGKKMENVTLMEFLLAYSHRRATTSEVSMEI